MKEFVCLLAVSVPLFCAPPGAVLPGMTRDKVCASQFSVESRSEHPVSSGLRKKVLIRDGYSPNTKGMIIDHVIPVELGGSNAIDNLQAQTRENARTKDRVENKLHRMVCASADPIPLQQAQQAIAAYATYQTGIR